MKLQIDELEHLKKQLPALQAIELRRTAGIATPEDDSRWVEIYAAILQLFSPRHADLIEQRRALRIPVRLKIDYIINGERFHGMSHDISNTGVAIEYSQRLIEGSRTQLLLTLSERRVLGLLPRSSLTVDATVRWRNIKSNRIGLEFLSIHPFNRRRIEKLLRRRIENRISECLQAARNKLTALTAEIH